MSKYTISVTLDQIGAVVVPYAGARCRILDTTASRKSVDLAENALKLLLLSYAVRTHRIQAETLSLGSDLEDDIHALSSFGIHRPFFDQSGMQPTNRSKSLLPCSADTGRDFSPLLPRMFPCIQLFFGEFICMFPRWHSVAFWVFILIDLNIKSCEICAGRYLLSWNDHEGTDVTVDCATSSNIGKVGVSDEINYAPDMISGITPQLQIECSAY
ncbi:hypothetical protein KCU90_g12, partial [Aureobasidium melanogenum]